MVFKSGTQQLEKRIQELKQFVDVDLALALGGDEPSVSAMTSVRRSLETLEPSLKVGKLSLKVIAGDSSLIDSFKATYQKQPACQSLFDFEPITFDEPDRIVFGDVVVGLIRPDDSLSEPWQYWAQQIDHDCVLKFIIIRVVPSDVAANTQSVQLDDITAAQRFKASAFKLTPTVLSLCLESFLHPPKPEIESEPLSSKPAPTVERGSKARAASSRIRERKSRIDNKPGRTAKPKSSVTDFFSSLETLAQTNREAIACRPLVTTLVQLTSQLMDTLADREQQLGYQLGVEKAKIKTDSEINVQQQVGIAFRKADQKIDAVLSKSRTDVGVLKGILLDAQDVRSIKSQLQQQIDGLCPVIDELKGTMKLELLHRENLDIHQSLVGLTGNFLNSWSQKAWQRIFEAPHRDGLHQLCDELPQMVNLAPVLAPHQPEVFKARLNPTFDIQHLFNSEFKSSFVWCRRYKFPTFPKFVFKDLRTNLMAVTGLVMLMSYVLNMGPESASSGTAQPVVEQTVHQAVGVLDSVVSWFNSLNPNLKGISILLFFPFALKTSMITYREDKEEKQEAEIEKMVKEGSKHYQTIAIAYVNKFIDFLNAQLDGVEHSLKYELNELKLSYNNTLAEVNKKITRNKLGLKQVTDAQKRLRKIRELI